MEKKNLLGIFIFAGFLAIAISVVYSVRYYTGAYRNVTVKGLCEKEVVADRVIWPIVYKEGGNSLVDLARTVESKNAAIQKWLLDAGFSREEITISSPKVEDLTTTYYSEKHTYNYIMTCVVTVCSDKVAKAIEMQSKQFDMLGKGIAIGAGNSWDYPVVFEYTSLNDIKTEMIEQAIVNAREAAQKFAKDSGSKLGEINTATQGQFSITDRDANNPHLKTVRVVTTVNYALK